MKVKVLNKALSEIKSELLVVTVTSEDLKSAAEKSARKNATKSSIGFAQLDEELGGALGKRLMQTGYKGKAGQSTLIQFADKQIQAVLVYGWDNALKGSYDSTSAYRRLASACFESGKRVQAATITLCPAHLDLKSEANLTAFAEALPLSAYRFGKYQPKDNAEEKNDYVGPNCIEVLSSKALSSRAIDHGQWYAEATTLARDLINTPPNDCTPRFLVENCKEVAKKNGLKIDIYDPKALKKMGAGALLAVAAGSDEPAYLVRMVYKPKKASKKVVAIVGKGVTFDSGGLSIKPGSGMETMKMDMSGAAAVIATMSVIAKLKPNFEVRAYVPTTENMINGKATRPGDIVTAMSGKTIEILNTDAEGRLILADAITLAERDGCPVIIDLATLTGACMVALGTDYAGLFANDDKLADGLLKASALAGERLWRMPLAPEYKDWIKSPVAHIKNLGKPFGGAITAALFLQEFVSKAQWAHLDIAGPAFVEGDHGHIRRGGVGFGVRTLLNYLQQVA